MFKVLSDMARVIAMLTILASCRSSGSEAAFWENEREKIELAQRLQLAEYRLRLYEPGDFHELEHLQSLLSENEVRLRKLQSDKSALISNIGRMEARNAGQRRNALEKQQALAHGMNFDSLSVRDGRTFNNVIVTGVGDSGLVIRHEHGSARLRYADLSEGQRLFFGLEESAAHAAEDRERRETLAYELSIDLELEAMREKGREERAESIAQGNSRASRSLMASSNYQHENRPLAQPARPLGNGSSYRRSYRFPQYIHYRPAYRYVYRYPSTPNPFCKSTSSRHRVTAQGMVGSRGKVREFCHGDSSQNHPFIPCAP